MATQLIGCDQAKKDHEIAIRKWRAERYEFFAQDPSSPFTLIQQRSFQGLSYFPFLHEAEVPITVKKLVQPDSVSITLTSGERTTYLHVGVGEFEWHGQLQKLQLYQLKGNDPQYFIPFGDETNTVETYGGGRFLDLPVESPTIDFNKSYNPYCAYNHQFVCPLPPKENYLSVRITAGEKQYD